ASTVYSHKRVKSMIEIERDCYGWEFLFIGANIDAVKEASHIGIRANRAVNYVADEIGTERVYEGVGRAVCCMSMAPASFEMDDSWREGIDEDYRRRSRRGRNKRKDS
ncbi:MAG: hypothetical protein IJP54_02655, partial [Synergistaceae bacterium]|nr:hypothetical protein [Synergistaceae bacterium]